MSCIAIIPARGGSKRLPRKNILPLGQKPLLQWVIEACMNSKVFDDVIVSSEDAEIQSLAEALGATLHYRKTEIAGDRSTVVEVCLSVLEDFQSSEFCCVYATAALLTPLTLIKSGEVFSNSHEADALMGVSKFNHSPLQALSIGENGFAKMLFPDFMKVQSQFYPETRVSNGMFYWVRSKAFLEEKTFYCEKLKVYDVPENETCDLDTEDDYIALKKLFNKRS